jgi:hypothetical protein
MKLGIGEDAFRDFGDEALPVTGRFVKLTSVTLVTGEDDRHPSFDVEAEFEKREAVLFMMTLSSENKVEGLEFNPHVLMSRHRSLDVRLRSDRASGVPDEGHSLGNLAVLAHARPTR